MWIDTRRNAHGQGRDHWRWGIILCKTLMLDIVAPPGLEDSEFALMPPNTRRTAQAWARPPIPAQLTSSPRPPRITDVAGRAIAGTT